MNFKEAYLQVVEALTGLDSLPVPDLTPQGIESTKQFPALYIGWGIVSFDAADFKWIEPTVSTEIATVYVHVHRDAANLPPVSIMLMDHALTIIAAIKALTSTDGLNFRCRVSNIRADYVPDAPMGEVRMDIVIGGFLGDDD